MGKLLEAFAENELSVIPVTYKGNAQYQEAVDSMCRLAEQLSEKLDEEGNQLFEKFRNAQAKAEWNYARDRFIDGYRTGVLMMTEIFTESDDLIGGDGAVA